MLNSMTIHANGIIPRSMVAAAWIVPSVRLVRRVLSAQGDLPVRRAPSVKEVPPARRVSPDPEGLPVHKVPKA